MASDADAQEAEEARLRTALAVAPDSARDAVALADLLVAGERADEADTLMARFTARADADIHVLTAHAAALKTLGRMDEALALYERAREAAPASGVAEHNLAGALGDMQRFAEAEAAVRRAFAKGLDAPQTWLVVGRARQGQGALDAAERSFREAINRKPDYADAIGDLAQLIWMRTADLSLACRPLDEALGRWPGSSALRLKKAWLLEYAGDAAGAYAALTADGAALEWPALVRAAQLASGLDPERALDHARRAAAEAPGQAVVMAGLCQAQLALGDATAAEQTAAAMHARWPNDQHALAFLATAWRLAGDPRYGELYDYDRFVSAESIETPPGWSSLEAFLSDLAAALERLHVFRTHPLGQSVRHGSQTEQSLRLSDDPVIRALFEAVDAPIRRHIAALGAGDDPLRRRLGSGYRFGEAWSVRLRPHGFHANHVHQKGWLSSAFYVRLPAAIELEREGWLKFGEPGVATRPVLGPEHWVRPRPGLLALFPSYMWHGTQPFGGDEPRLSIAFDLLPA